MPEDVTAKGKVSKQGQGSWVGKVLTVPTLTYCRYGVVIPRVTHTVGADRGKDSPCHSGNPEMSRLVSSTEMVVKSSMIPGDPGWTTIPKVKIAIQGVSIGSRDGDKVH